MSAGYEDPDLDPSALSDEDLDGVYAELHGYVDRLQQEIIARGVREVAAHTGRAFTELQYNASRLAAELLEVLPELAREESAGSGRRPLDDRTAEIYGMVREQMIKMESALELSGHPDPASTWDELEEELREAYPQPFERD